MLIRISLILAILAGLAVGTIDFVYVKKVIVDTRAERDDWHNKYTDTDTKLNKATRDLAKANADLKSTKQALDTTTAELTKAQADVATLTKKSTDLADQLSKTKAERDDAQATVDAYKQSGLNPAQVASLAHDMEKLRATITGLQAENKGLGQTLAKRDAELLMYRDPNAHVELKPTVTGKVLACDPKWDFVILDVGEDQGAIPKGELLVRRNGNLVAVVRITRVEKDRCTANVVPGWKLGDVMEGDQVFPFYPSS